MIVLFTGRWPDVRLTELLDVSPETPRDAVLQAIADELAGEELTGIGLIGKASVEAYGWLKEAFAAETEMIGPSMRLAPLHRAPTSTGLLKAAGLN